MAGKRAQKQQEIIERRREVARLRLSGVRHQQDVADRLGVSVGTINADFKAIDAQWHAETTLDIDAEKRLDLARIEAMIVVLWPLALNAKTYAIDRIVTLMQHKAKLLGTEAPVKREDTITVQTQAMAEYLAQTTGLDKAEIVAEAQRIVVEAAGNA